MRQPCSLKRTLAAVLPTLLLVTPTMASAQTVVSTEPFRSVTLLNGGTVILRHATSTRVTLLKGSTDHTSVAVRDGDRLVIDRCRGGCPKDELVVEILAPDVDGLMVTNGGTIESRGDFPRQAELSVAVEQGGTVDVRAMTADQVTAAVREGGRILTRPNQCLVAAVAGGGGIIYWGRPRITSSVQDGGVVSRGAEDDADKLLVELGSAYSTLSSVPPIPPVPPVPPIRIRTL